MAEFRPIFPAHAIERCSITLAFGNELPEKAMRRLLETTTPTVAELGLRPGQQPLGFQIDASTGRVTPLSGGGPANFVSADNKQQLTLMPNTIAWATQQYIRWAQFKTQFFKIADKTIEEYDSLASISTVQLEYWDRFIWTGNWSDFDPSQLLTTPYKMVAPEMQGALKEWHSHVGWFEDIPDARRLRNLNVDVIGLASPAGSATPSVGVYTMVRDQVSVEQGQEKFDSTPVTDRLDTLHMHSKNMLKDLISQGMADRIGLDSGG